MSEQIEELNRRVPGLNLEYTPSDERGSDILAESDREVEKPAERKLSIKDKMREIEKNL